MHIRFFIVITIMVLQGCMPSKKETLKTSMITIENATDSLSMLAEHVISTALYERDLAINPTGDQMIYTLADFKQTKRCLVVMNKENNLWTAPEIMSISGKYHDIEPFYATDGNRLYFASNRPIYNDLNRTDFNIWYSDNINGEWTKPIALDSIINTRGDEYFPSVTEKGTLFFTATRKDGIGKEDIFMATYENGSFTAPTVLPSEINTKHYEFNAFVSPKEDLIIFSSYGRSDDLGGGDLYISYKDTNGLWTPSKNMGSTINSNKLDFCPFIDFNKGVFYFTSERVPENSMTIKHIDALKKHAANPQNGYGNIYHINLHTLDLNLKTN